MSGALPGYFLYPVQGGTSKIVTENIEASRRGWPFFLRNLLRQHCLPVNAMEWGRGRIIHIPVFLYECPQLFVCRIGLEGNVRRNQQAIRKYY